MLDYEKLYEESPDMHLSVAPTGLVVRCNRTLLTRLGWDVDEVIGQPLLKLYHPDCHDHVKANLQSFRETGRVKHRELLVVRKDGSPLHVSLEFTPIRDDDGNVMFSNAVWRDISALMELRDQLEHRKADAEKAAVEFQRLYDLAPDMYLSVAAPSGIVVKCNTTLLERLGYAKADVIGRPLLPLYHPDDHPKVKENLASFVATGKVKHTEFLVVKKDGGTIEVSLDFAPVRDESGNVLYSNAVWRDITALKEAERELAREKEKSEKLLLNVLPEPIARRLRDGEEGPIADGFEEVSVLFADVVGFTPLSARLDARTTVVMLNEIFTAFDEICQRHGVEKVRTIGDGYMVIAGAPEPRVDHAEVLGRVALEIAELMTDRDDELRIRIGLNSGPAVAGVVGTTKFHYDVWGDAVNVAARMESTGEPSRIQIAEGTHRHLQACFTCEARGEIEIKGKGKMPTWWLVGRA